jgi:hypothetical protein
VGLLPGYRGLLQAVYAELRREAAPVAQAASAAQTVVAAPGLTFRVLEEQTFEGKLFCPRCEVRRARWPQRCPRLSARCSQRHAPGIFAIAGSSLHVVHCPGL